MPLPLKRIQEILLGRAEQARLEALNQRLAPRVKEAHISPLEKPANVLLAAAGGFVGGGVPGAIAGGVAEAVGGPERIDPLAAPTAGFARGAGLKAITGTEDIAATIPALARPERLQEKATLAAGLVDREKAIPALATIGQIQEERQSKKDELERKKQELDILKRESMQKLKGKPRQLSEKGATAIADLDDIVGNYSDALKQMERFGLKPDPITGRIPFISEELKAFFKTPEWNNWRARVGRQFQKYRKIVTGAQASDREIRLLEPLMPQDKDKDRVFLEKTLGVKDEMLDKRGRLLNAYESAGFDVENFRITEPTDEQLIEEAKRRGLQ